VGSRGEAWPAEKIAEVEKKREGRERVCVTCGPAAGSWYGV
jgi:hypothetical protein